MEGTQLAALAEVSENPTGTRSSEKLRGRQLCLGKMLLVTGFEITRKMAALVIDLTE